MVMDEQMNVFYYEGFVGVHHLPSQGAQNKRYDIVHNGCQMVK